MSGSRFFSARPNAADGRRSAGIDALRTLAILGMMAAHTSRMIVFEVRPPWCAWILLLEPLIPSLFLFLVGLSLTISVARAPNRAAWYKRQAWRAAGLWIISAVFFFAEMGFRLPDVLVASGILCTIAYSILIVGALLLLPQPGWLIGILLAAATAAFAHLDQHGLRAFPWNIGNAPLFPFVPFALAGALWGLLRKRRPGWMPVIGIAAAAGAWWILHRYGLHPLFTREFGRTDATRVLAPQPGGGEERLAAFYNLGPWLSLFCLCVHVALLGVGEKLFAFIPEKAARFLFVLGRHSLQIYVLHLTLLAALVVTRGPRPLTSAFQGDAVIVGLFALMLGWAFLREKRAIRKRMGKNIDTSR